MSAEILRRAAALMRERATAVVPDGYGESWFHPDRIKACLLAWPKNRDDEKYGAFHARRDAEHMAAWNPAVALLVAKLLDDTAETWEMCCQDEAFRLSVDTIAVGYTREHALNLARAYLGESS